MDSSTSLPHVESNATIRAKISDVLNCGQADPSKRINGEPNRRNFHKPNRAGKNDVG